MKKTFLRFAVTGILGLALAGCAARATYIVRTPPPPARVEVLGIAPSPRHVWQEGFWAWRGGRYHWVPGHWVIAPRRGAIWVPGHWAPRRGGYVWIEGYWR